MRQAAPGWARPTLLAVLTVMAVAGGCASAPAVDLTASWPRRPAEYDDAYDRWTRHARARVGFDTAIDAYVTFKSADWRAAFVAEIAARADLSPSERAELAQLQQLEMQKALEFELVVATHYYAWNDFARPQSIWRIRLLLDDGTVVEPLDIRGDDRARGEILSYFPDLSPFHKAYVVKFPRTLPDGRPILGPTTRRLRMKIGSTLGAVEFVWHAR